MSLRGFWSKRNAKNHKDRSVLRAPPAPPEKFPEGSWQDHPDRETVAKAEKALCTKVNHRDS